MAEETETPESSEEESFNSSDSFLFKGAIEIFPYDELPHLSKVGALACRAKGKKGEKYFAMLCERNTFPRTKLVTKYNNLQTQYMAGLVASGVTGFSKQEKQLLSQQYYVFVFEDIYGDPFTDTPNKATLNIKPEIVRYNILPSLVGFLQDADKNDFLHGSLHLGNIYNLSGIQNNDVEGVNGVCVGECLSLPYSYDMPREYLTISRSSVPPIARGRGVFSDEIYSLGVLLSMMLRRTDPCAGLSDDEVIKLKMDQGSYQAIVGDNRIDVYFLNALRGMLQDDPEQRWTLDDVSMWVDGQRIGVKQGGIKRLNANRPLPFVKDKYIRPELLGYDFKAHVQEAHQLIISGELEKWVDRSVANPALKARLQLAYESSDKYGQKTGHLERKVAQVALALNNDSSLFYKDIDFLPDGFGLSFAKALVDGEEIKAYAQMLEISLISFWVENKRDDAADVAVLLSAIESCRMSAKQAGMGYGIERCAYLLNSDIPCLSPKFEDYYIKTPEDYFVALNDLSIKDSGLERIVDRHVAAFISVRDRQMIDAYLADINSDVAHVKAIALLKMLATIQLRANLDKAPGISNWVVDHLSKPLLERIHDRDMRKSIDMKLKRLASNGDVVAIASLFEKETVLRKDRGDFNNAMKEYQNLIKQEKILDYNIKNNKRYGQGTGREVASIVSAGLGFLIVLVIIFWFFGERLMG